MSRWTIRATSTSSTNATFGWSRCPCSDTWHAGAMALTDKTGAPVTVLEDTGKFTVAVEGRSVGQAAFADRDGQRVFFHTEIDKAFGGRGLASVLIREALAQTRADGM